MSKKLTNIELILSLTRIVVATQFEIIFGV